MLDDIPLNNTGQRLGEIEVKITKPRGRFVITNNTQTRADILYGMWHTSYTIYILQASQDIFYRERERERLVFAKYDRFLCPRGGLRVYKSREIIIIVVLRYLTDILAGWTLDIT